MCVRYNDENEHHDPPLTVQTLGDARLLVLVTLEVSAAILRATLAVLTLSVLVALHLSWCHVPLTKDCSDLVAVAAARVPKLLLRTLYLSCCFCLSGWLWWLGQGCVG